MSEIKLFRAEVGGVTQLHGSNVALEKELQTLMERNLETFLGVRFLASELTTSNGGRIDSLGIDENNAPVIIEYKRSRNENVINQGLFYLDWLMDHKADFTMLAMDALGAEIKDIIDWSGPRLICIAGDFNKYDGYAVQQMGRNIDLVRYDRLRRRPAVARIRGRSCGKFDERTIGTRWHHRVVEGVQDSN